MSNRIWEAVRQGQIVHHGCLMMPWRWWRPECEFPISSEDGYWGRASEEQCNEMLQRLKRDWEKKARTRAAESSPA